MECQRNLKRLGFKNIYYSKNIGNEKIKIKDLNSEHISKAQRKIDLKKNKYLRIK